MRGWTDEIFDLFIEGRLERLSAAEVCRAIDWIASQPLLLAQIDEGLPDGERRRRLVSLVRAGAAAGGLATPRARRAAPPMSTAS